MKKLFLPLLFLVLAACLLTGGLLFSTSSAAPAQDEPAVAQRKIAPWVLERTAKGDAAECLVILRERADLTGAARLQAKEAKGRYVRDALFNQAQQSQRALLDWLREREIEHRSFYIVNAIWVKASREIIEQLAARREVERIDANPQIKQQFEPQLDEAELRAALNRAPAAPEAIEPGVTFIRAPEVWAQGFTGQGIVIGGADTGVRWDHAALRNQYRGWDGAAANHNFNWHDSIHNSAGNPCGNDSPFPCDDDSHGTHTLGTAVGTDGGTNQIGVAPGAKWIGCRNMDNGNGTPARYIECMEWFLAPYPIGGTPAQGDPSKAPDITTNSWSCPPSEGCQPASLQQAVEAQRAAGIMMVVAAGNSGSSCSTVSDPPSFYAASYTVGAISASTGNIASFSSRGPATIDGSNRLKPEITAPGVGVRSAVNSGGYASFNGTSMATPHVAGAIALLWAARPNLRHQIQQTIELVNQAAVDVNISGCSSSGVPNNIYGWGRLDIKAAVDAAGGGGCSYAIAPTGVSVSAAANTGMVNVTTGVNCQWTATSNAAWLTITTAPNGSGNGTVGYMVAANAGAARSGTLTIAGATFTVNQAAFVAPSVAKKDDFDGDGKTDLSVWRGLQSTWLILRSSNNQVQTALWGASYAPYNDVAVPGDYDGDGKYDIAVWRALNGTWYIINSSNGQVTIRQHGVNGDTPVPADYDGDGKTDLAVWKGTQSLWSILKSSDGTTQTAFWGASYAPYNDIPVPADYDGDGKADIAVWRQANGTWYIINSTTLQFRIQQHGMAGDVPVPGDYDGDGKADLGAWRGEQTTWHIRRSTNDTLLTVSWGASYAPYHDIPVPGDYDGDGKSDIAVWRSLDGTWYVIRSSNNSPLVQGHGQAGDTPCPSVGVR